MWKNFTTVTPTRVRFSDLNVGDVFRVRAVLKDKNVCYRKIPLIEITGVGERNAAMSTNESWVYFPPDTKVVHFGKTDLEVDRGRAERQASHKSP